MSSVVRVSASSGERAAAFRLFVEQRADRVDYLLAPAIADGECHVRAGGALPGRLYRLFQRAGGAAGQHIERARGMDLPGGLWPGQPDGDDVLDDLHEERDLGVTAPLQVLRGAHEHGHVPDPGPLAPVQDVLDVLGSVLVPQAGTGQPRLPGPAAVAVHDQRDVPGQGGAGQLPAQLAGIQAIGKIAQHIPNLPTASQAGVHPWWGALSRDCLSCRPGS